jgi:hypothetical protein
MLITTTLLCAHLRGPALLGHCRRWCAVRPGNRRPARRAAEIRQANAALKSWHAAQPIAGTPAERQPDRLNSLLVKGDDDGLLARFLVVFPDPVRISRPTNAIDTERLKDAFNRLRRLPPAIDENGKDCRINAAFDEAALTQL